MCERLLVVWRWTCSTHAGSGLCGCGREFHRRHCVPFGVDQAVLLLALFVDFRWSVDISWIMGLLEEQDSAVVGMFFSFQL